MIDFNPNSDDHISLLLFGGTVKEVIKKPIIINGELVRIKSGDNKGNIKYKNYEETYKIKGLDITPKEEWQCKKEGFYKTNEDILIELQKTVTNKAKEILDLIIEIRGLDKEIGTYYEGIEERIYDKDDCIRCSYNHT